MHDVPQWKFQDDDRNELWLPIKDSTTVDTLNNWFLSKFFYRAREHEKVLDNMLPPQTLGAGVDYLFDTMEKCDNSIMKCFCDTLETYCRGICKVVERLHLREKYCESASKDKAWPKAILRIDSISQDQSVGDGTETNPIKHNMDILCEELEICDSLIEELKEQNLVRDDIRELLEGQHTRASKIRYLMENICPPEKGFKVLQDYIKRCNTYLFEQLEISSEEYRNTEVFFTCEAQLASYTAGSNLARFKWVANGMRFYDAEQEECRDEHGKLSYTGSPEVMKSAKDIPLDESVSIVPESNLCDFWKGLKMEEERHRPGLLDLNLQISSVKNFHHLLYQLQLTQKLEEEYQGFKATKCAILNLRGAIQFFLQNYEESCETFEKVLEEDEVNLNALRNLEIIYRQLGIWDKAGEYGNQSKEALASRKGLEATYLGEQGFAMIFDCHISSNEYERFNRAKSMFERCLEIDKTKVVDVVTIQWQLWYVQLLYKLMNACSNNDQKFSYVKEGLKYCLLIMDYLEKAEDDSCKCILSIATAYLGMFTHRMDDKMKSEFKSQIDGQKSALQEITEPLKNKKTGIEDVLKLLEDPESAFKEAVEIDENTEVLCRYALFLNGKKSNTGDNLNDVEKLKNLEEAEKLIDKCIQDTNGGNWFAFTIKSSINLAKCKPKYKSLATLQAETSSATAEAMSVDLKSHQSQDTGSWCKDATGNAQPPSSSDDATENAQPPSSSDDAQENAQPLSSNDDATENAQPPSSSEYATENAQPPSSSDDATENAQPQPSSEYATENAQPPSSSDDAIEMSRSDAHVFDPTLEKWLHESINYGEKAGKLNATSKIYSDLGEASHWCALNQKEDKEKEKYFFKALANFLHALQHAEGTKIPFVHYCHGKCLLDMKQYLPALESFKRAIECGTRRPKKAYKKLVKCYIELLGQTGNSGQSEQKEQLLSDLAYWIRKGNEKMKGEGRDWLGDILDKLTKKVKSKPDEVARIEQTFAAVAKELGDWSSFHVSEDYLKEHVTFTLSIFGGALQLQNTEFSKSCIEKLDGEQIKSLEDNRKTESIQNIAMSFIGYKDICSKSPWKDSLSGETFLIDTFKQLHHKCEEFAEAIANEIAKDEKHHLFGSLLLYKIDKEKAVEITDTSTEVQDMSSRELCLCIRQLSIDESQCQKLKDCLEAFDKRIEQISREKGSSAIVEHDVIEPKVRKTKYKYDFCVIYSEKDADWVVHSLLPTLERKYGFHGYLENRDLLPGQSKFRVLEIFKESYKVIVIVTDNFCDDSWCYYVFQQAMYGKLGEQSIIPIQKSKLKEMPKELQAVISLTAVHDLDHVGWERLVRELE